MLQDATGFYCLKDLPVRIFFLVLFLGEKKSKCVKRRSFPKSDDIPDVYDNVLSICVTISKIESVTI